MSASVLNTRIRVITVSRSGLTYWVVVWADGGPEGNGYGSSLQEAMTSAVEAWEDQPYARIEEGEQP